MKWNKTYHGIVVNLYLIRKMFKSKSPIEHIDKMMYEAYLADLKYKTKEVKNMSYADYLNWKRQFLASVMGLREYF